MNTQEREQLSQLLQQLAVVKLTEKNSEAEGMIRDAVARQPDAAYLLVQRCLLQDQALHAAQAQIADLQGQLQKASESGPGNNRFLGGNDPWSAGAGRANGVPGGSTYQIPSAAAADQNRAAPQATGLGFGSSFLGNVATTAAGVVAGSFLFQGIENLMGHHQSGFGQQAFGGQTPDQTTVINNYYGDDQQPAWDAGNDYLASDDGESFFDGGDTDSDWM